MSRLSETERAADGVVVVVRVLVTIEGVHTEMRFTVFDFDTLTGVFQTDTTRPQRVDIATDEAVTNLLTVHVLQCRPPVSSLSLIVHHFDTHRHPVESVSRTVDAIPHTVHVDSGYTQPSDRAVIEVTEIVVSYSLYYGLTSMGRCIGVSPRAVADRRLERDSGHELSFRPTGPLIDADVDVVVRTVHQRFAVSDHEHL